MNVSAALNILRQCPGNYPLQVLQGGEPHEVLAAEYSHEPARAVLKIAEARSPLAPPRPDAKREITSHKVNPCNDLITLSVLDEPGAGGANHRYLASFVSAGIPHAYGIDFQNGPIGEHGVNGLTQEVLLAIVIDRLEAFQRGPFACKDNEDALSLIKGGLTCLLKRTQRRMAQGVEGTHEKHVEPAALPEPEATIAELRGEIAPLPVPVVPEHVEPVMDAAEVAEAMATMAVDPYAEPGVTSSVTVSEEGVTVAEVAEEPTPTIAEQVVALAKAKRSRKPKAAPAAPTE